jgi:hypothetical protein
MWTLSVERLGSSQKREGEMPKLRATAFRLTGHRDGTCVISFRDANGRIFEISCEAASLPDLAEQIQKASRVTDIPVSLRQSIGFRSMARNEISPFVEGDANAQKGMRFGAAISVDTTLVIPYFDLPDADGAGTQTVAIGMPVDDAQKLVDDLQRAIDHVKTKGQMSQATH